MKILTTMFFALSACTLAAQSREVTGEEVLRVHRSALLIDTHNDVTSETLRGLDIGKPSVKTHTDIPRLRAGGVGAVFFAVYVPSAFVAKQQSAHRALEMIDTVRHDIVERYPEVFDLALSAAGIEAAQQRGKIAALMGVEGGHAIEDSLRVLRAYYAAGCRYMTLTHSNNNNWADSSGDRPRHHGLTAFGKSVVREMNRLGMMVDISHVSDKTFWDALATSRAPVFASHSGCRALSNIPRNLNDEMIQALAKHGGVVQINFGCEFVSQRSADTSTWTSAALKKQYDAEAAKLPTSEERQRLAREYARKMTRATLAEVVRQIQHVVKLAGIDHVGIGSDFDGVECTPVGLEDVSRFPNLTRALLEEGFSGSDIHKIYGGNLLRLMRAVESAAGKQE